MAISSDISAHQTKMNGFFVFLSKKPSFVGVKNKSNARWIAVLVENIERWPATSGATPEEAMELQKAQYRDKLSNNQPVPNLLRPNDGPIASGKMTRFIIV